MPIIRVALLEDGMILSHDVLDRDGAVILPAGIDVDRHVRSRLVMAGVRKVAVRDGADRAAVAPAGTSSSLAGPASPSRNETAALQAALQKIAHMFADHRDDPLMRELCRLAIQCAREGVLGG
ncbi:MAG: hypothetical protein LIP77_08050 [Planctomycetes bacterium]|nr:hypothetical protein [Planctomycetota bacterium]